MMRALLSKPGDGLATATLKGVQLKVPAGDYSEVQRLALILFGMTRDNTSEKTCAIWALNRATALVPALRREARKVQ